MLDHLRQKAARALASVSSVILSSYGPADIQSSRVFSATQDLILYVFVPISSDHLLNLEHGSGVAVATDSWDLHATAHILLLDEIPAGILPPEGMEDSPGLTRAEASLNFASGWRVVEIRPTRLTLHSKTGLGNIETIDF